MNDNEAYEKGRHDYYRGIFLTDNPINLEDVLDWLDWLNGWCDAYKEDNLAKPDGGLQ